MSLSVAGVFSSYDHAKAAIDLLLQTGVNAKQLCITGTDCDHFREVISALRTHKVSKLILVLPLAGMLVGGYWGYIGCPHLDAPPPSAIISTMMAMFCGGMIGLWLATHASAIVNLDNLPDTEAALIEAPVEEGVISIAVVATDYNQSSRVLTDLLKAGARTVKQTETSH